MKRGECSLLRALACGGRSHTCRLRSVFSEVHAPGKNGFELFFALRGEKSEGDPSELPDRIIAALVGDSFVVESRRKNGV